MIFELIGGAIFTLISTLLNFKIPSLPAEVEEYISLYFDYMRVGVGVLNNYAPLGLFKTLLVIVLAVEAVLLTYYIIMWVIKKLPFSIQ